MEGDSAGIGWVIGAAILVAAIWWATNTRLRQRFGASVVRPLLGTLGALLPVHFAVAFCPPWFGAMQNVLLAVAEVMSAVIATIIVLLGNALGAGR